MRTYHVEYKDPRDDMCLNIDDVKADLFVVSDDNVIVTFYVENSNIGGSIIPVAMFPFSYVVSINSKPAEEGDSE